MTSIKDSTPPGASGDIAQNGHEPPFRKARDAMAVEYRARGWQLVREGSDNQGALEKGWPNLDPAPEDFGANDNLGVKTGTKSKRLIDIDADSSLAVALAPQFFPPTAALFGRPAKPLSHRIYVATGDDPIIAKKYILPNDKGVHLEIRADAKKNGGALKTTFPPSRHPEGGVVAWATDDGSVPMPAAVTFDELVTAGNRTMVAIAVIRQWQALDYGRHDMMLAISTLLLQAGWPIGDGEHLFRAIHSQVAPDRLEESLRGLSGTLDSIATGELVTGLGTLKELIGGKVANKIETWIGGNTAAIPASDRFTDIGNVNRLVDRHGHRLRHCDGLGLMHYYGHQWTRDAAKAAFGGAAKETAYSWMEEAEQITDPNEKIAMRKHGIKSLSWPSQWAMLELVKIDERIQVGIDELDAATWLLNVRNGTLNLQGGEVTFRSHDPDDLITKRSPTLYVPGAECPLWLETLLLAIPDPEERRFFHKFVGYSITDAAFEKLILLVWGMGDSGKTTVVNTPRDVLGEDYAQVVAEKTIAAIAKGHEGVPSDIARLRGARYGVVSETNEGTRLNIGRLKAWSGRNRLIGRFMRENEFEFDMTMKLAIETNHKPIVTEADDAFFHRLAMLQFKRQLPNIEKNFGVRLRAEYPGILNWMIEGCLLWQREGLEIPASMVEAREAYQAEMSPVADFFAERLRFEPTEKPVLKKDVYSLYNTWADENNIPPVWRLVSRRLYALVEEQPGVVAKSGTGNAKVFWNVRIITRSEFERQTL